jgi:hypothetical protein
MKLEDKIQFEVIQDAFNACNPIMVATLTVKQAVQFEEGLMRQEAVKKVLTAQIEKALNIKGAA